MTLIHGETGTQSLIGYVLDVGAPQGRGGLPPGPGRPLHLNRQGILHGGLAATLLDSAMGATGSLTVDATGRHPFTTLSLTVQLISRPAPPARVEPPAASPAAGAPPCSSRRLCGMRTAPLIATATGVFPARQSRPMTDLTNPHCEISDLGDRLVVENRNAARRNALTPDF